MKTFSPARGALALAASLCLLAPGASAQKGDRLPGRLDENSKVPQLVEWLGEAVLAGARVGLNHDGEEIRNPITREFEGETLAERFVFSQGFRVAKLEDCALTLRNDDVKLLRYADDAFFTIGGGGSHPLDDVGRSGTRYAAEMLVPLRLLSDRKGRVPYRHTKDSKQAALLGVWRATYRTRGRGRHVSIKVFPAERPEEMRDVDGDMLSFTFDDKAAADNFHAAFRRAIRLCKD